MLRLYHYCSMRQSIHPGVLSYSSGTISSNADLSRTEEYLRLRDAISKKMDEGSTGGGDIVILSLTVIGEITP